jgi:hypothetical protein
VKTVFNNKLYGAGFTKDLFQPTYIFDPDINDLEPVINFFQFLSVQCKHIPALGLGDGRYHKTGFQSAHRDL